MGKKVIITGSRGIAAGLARALNQRNYEIYLLGGEEADSASLAKECSNIVGFNSIDLRNESQVESAFTQAIKKLNGLDHVVSIVGGSGRSFGDGGIEEITKSAWDKTLELNLTTAFLTAREAIKYFNANGPGSLTLTSSTLANSPSPEHFKTHAYAASKGAINTLVVTLASSYLDKKIRVNAVSPSLVATPMAARAAEIIAATSPLKASHEIDRSTPEIINTPRNETPIPSHALEGIYPPSILTKSAAKMGCSATRAVPAATVVQRIAMKKPMKWSARTNPESAESAMAFR